MILIPIEKRALSSIFAPQFQQNAVSFTQNSSIPLGIVSILGGLLLAFLGKRLFRLSLFLIGFYIFAVLAYTVLAYSEPMDTNGRPLWANREYIYLGTCTVVGLLGGFLSSCLFKLGIFLVGAAAGFFVSAYIITAAGIQSDVVVISLSVGLAVLFGIGSLFMSDYAIIFGTAFVGGYLVGFGIDVFVNTGIMHSLNAIIAKHTFSATSLSLTGPAIGILAGMIVVTVLGLIVQLRNFKSNRKSSF